MGKVFVVMAWVFGYGSLMWKVDFDTDVHVAGHIEGYRRVFYQVWRACNWLAVVKGLNRKPEN